METKPDPAITQAIQRWINKDDLPRLIEAISAACHQKYEEWLDSPTFRKVWLTCKSHEEMPVTIRADHDLACAFLCVHIEYAADCFRERVRTAGMSVKEKEDDRRLVEIAKLEADLAAAKGRFGPAQR